MTYVTQAALIARFGATEIAQISDLSGQGVTDAARITQIVNDVQARVDSYLAGRYILPLTTVPGAIEQIAADMARYLLQDMRPTEEVRTRYQDGIRWLERVSEGKIQLGLDPASHQVGDAGGAQVGTTGGGRVFSSDSLSDYSDFPLGNFP